MLWAVLLIIGILILFFIAVMVIDCHRFVVRSYEVPSTKVKKDIRFVLLSDLHSVSFGKDNGKLVEAVKDLNPEGILIAGDMFTSRVGEHTDTALALLEKLSGICPVYYANGNHEQKVKESPSEFGGLYEDYVKKLSSFGITLLENDSVDLEDLNIRIFGLELPFRYYRKFRRIHPSKEEIDTLIGTSGEDVCNILIAHNPEYFADYASWGADLTVSGHVHGGLMRLPLLGGVVSPKFTLFPRYSGGIYRIGERSMVLSCGLGTHTLPIRIFNPGEVSLIRITHVF